MNILPANKCQKGFTLVELMVAMVLGLILTLGVIQVFVANQHSYKITDNLSRLQESGRFAMAFIAREVRVTEYEECLLLSPIAAPLAGTENLGVNTSDTITVKKSLTPDTSPCPALPAFEFTTTYSIQLGASGQPALFERIINNGADNDLELIEGIEDLQVIYGEDTDGDESPNYYVPANAVVDMAQVVSVRISLVAVTLEDNVASQANIVSVFGTVYTPPVVDKKIRRVFTSTIALRNRLS